MFLHCLIAFTQKEEAFFSLPSPATYSAICLSGSVQHFSYEANLNIVNCKSMEIYSYAGKLELFVTRIRNLHFTEQDNAESVTIA